MLKDNTEFIKQLKKDKQWTIFRLFEGLQRTHVEIKGQNKEVMQKAHSADITVIKLELKKQILQLDTTKDITPLLKLFDTIPNKYYKNLLIKTKQEKDIIAKIFDILDQIAKIDERKVEPNGGKLTVKFEKLVRDNLPLILTWIKNNQHTYAILRVYNASKNKKFEKAYEAREAKKGVKSTKDLDKTIEEMIERK